MGGRGVYMGAGTTKTRDTRDDQQWSSEAWLNSPLQWLDMTSAQSALAWDNWNGSTRSLRVEAVESRGLGRQGANIVDSGLYWAAFTTLPPCLIRRTGSMWFLNLSSALFRGYSFGLVGCYASRCCRLRGK